VSGVQVDGPDDDQQDGDGVHLLALHQLRRGVERRPAADQQQPAMAAVPLIRGTLPDAPREIHRSDR
jgi:hypothetical protein